MKKSLFEIGLIVSGKYIRIASDLSFDQSIRLKIALSEYCRLLIKFQGLQEAKP